MGASLVLVAATGGVASACIPFAVFGLADAAVLIAVDTYLQQAVPERLRGRVLAHALPSLRAPMPYRCSLEVLLPEHSMCEPCSS